MIVERQIRFGQERRGRKKAQQASATDKPTSRVPRVAKLMALAIRFDRLIRDGVVADQSELARIGQVSRARLTQIMNLLSLAPCIQEQLLLMPPTHGRELLTEKHLRPIAANSDWRDQTRMWSRREPC